MPTVYKGVDKKITIPNNQKEAQSVRVLEMMKRYSKIK